MTDINDLVTITEAARILNISRTAIYKAIERQAFNPVEAAGKQWLLKSEIATYHPQGLEGVRPSKRLRETTEKRRGRPAGAKNKPKSEAG